MAIYKHMRPTSGVSKKYTGTNAYCPHVSSPEQAAYTGCDDQGSGPINGCWTCDQSDCIEYADGMIEGWLANRQRLREGIADQLGVRLPK